MDIIHPPLWYFAWGIGLLNNDLITDSFYMLWLPMWYLILAYIIGRLVEGVFEMFTPISIFIWHRFDSFNRLITARRNPNLVLLTCFTVMGEPVWGLYAVVIWHGVSTLILFLRLTLAIHYLRKGWVLESWLARLDPKDARKDLAGRLFFRDSAL